MAAGTPPTQFGLLPWIKVGALLVIFLAAAIGLLLLRRSNRELGLA